MEIFFHAESWIALLTLTFLEIILGIDNIIFISLVVEKLPTGQQRLARNIGLLLALAMRIALLMSITYVIQLQEDILHLFNMGFSGRDLILLVGGGFLIAKSTSEIHQKVGAFSKRKKEAKKPKMNILAAIIQIVLLDIIFSIDSILTAIGLSKEVLLMIIAVIISLGIMMLFASGISRLINKYPTLQILALSFLILIGFTLVLDGLGREIEKGFIYFAVFFSLCVEMLNITMRKTS